jgi:hypothetical protein
MINTPQGRIWIAILALVASSGCALNVNLNANRFESPETSGALLAGSIDAAFTGSNTLILNAGAPAWDRSNASPRLSGSLGLLDRLDVSVKAPWDGPVLLQTKVQLLGAPLSRAQSGDFALAATFGVGATQPSGESLNTYDGALIAGYRIAETWMIYGGGFATGVRYSDTLGGSGNAVQSGGNVGLMLDSVLGAIKIEEAWTVASAASNQRTGFYTGACLSYRF